jgi:hypothetical protein
MLPSEFPGICQRLSNLCKLDHPTETILHLVCSLSVGHNSLLGVQNLGFRAVVQQCTVLMGSGG